jgi:tetratricopeptide (TPR) repeat protein
VPDSLKGGRYEIREILGQGATGVVYKCLDTATSTEVALKVLRDTPDELALDMFRKECGVLAGIGHPNVVEILDAGELPDAGGSKPFYAMPLLAGVPLERLIREGARHLTVERVVEVVAQACRGVQAAHERGLVHRNIKPGNVFVLPGGAVKVTDFGVAPKAATNYTAPEVAEGQPASALSDVYSLGVVAAEALAPLNPPAPQAVLDAVRKAMSRDPWGRFTSARDFGDALRQTVQAQGAGEAAGPVPSESERLAGQGREACAAGRVEEGIAALHRAVQLDPQNAGARAALADAAAKQARAALDKDLRHAAGWIDFALAVDPQHAEARSLRALMEERRGEEYVEQCASAARARQAAGDIAGALQVVEEGLRNRPGAQRLVEMQAQLRGATPPAAPPVPVKTATAQAAATAPGVAAQVAAAPKAGRKSPWKMVALIGGCAVLALAAVFGGMAVLRTRGKTETPAAVAMLDVRTVPPGATILINQKPQGTSNCQLRLPAATYEIQAIKLGYRPGVATLTLREGVPGVVDLPLEALPAALRVYTNLEPARLLLDDQPGVEVQGGQYVLDSLPYGRHTLRVASPAGEATLPIDVAMAAAPQIAGQLAAKGAGVLAIVVSSLGGQARVYASPAGVEASIDGRPAGAVGPEGLELRDLAPGGHELTLTQGKDVRKLSIETGPNPALTAFLNSDRDLGALVVATGEDGATVWLNGKQQRRTTRGGQLRILNLAVREYTVRVTKQGFQDPPEQKVQVKKGEDSRLVFALKPAPTMAAVVIEGAMPGAEIVIDGNAAGKIGPDGNFSMPNLTPGEHTVELRKDQHRPRVIVRSYQAGDTVRLSAADVALEALPKPEPKPAPKPVAPPPAAPVSAKVGMEGWPDASAWQSQGAWKVRRGGEFVLFKPTPSGGSFVFTVVAQRGKRLRWVARHAGDKNHLLFEIDDRYFYRKLVANGRTTDLAKVPHGIAKQQYLTVTVELRVQPGRVEHRVNRGGKWVLLDSWSDPNGNFTQGPFGFLVRGKDEIGLSDFSFTPLP